jgi:hypothetical protein
MTRGGAAGSGGVLPLPRFVLQPYTAALIAAVHLYLGAGHLLNLFGGEVEWTHVWKGLGALGGAYLFAALASRGLARQEGRNLQVRSGAGPGSHRHAERAEEKPLLRDTAQAR